MKRLVFLFSFIVLTMGIYCQEKQYLFTNISKTQGLSHNRILTFIRDRKGFLWVGTNKGLCRFDGYSFKVFKNDPKDSTSLKDNIINNLFEDNSGKLWVATGDYLDVFDPETETFSQQQYLFNKRVQVPVASRWFHFYDKNGNIIYVNDRTGIYKYIISTDSVFQIRFPYIDSTKTITYADIDKNGDIWIACSNSFLYKLHFDNYAIIDSIELMHKFHNSYRFITDNDNDLWVFDKDNASGVMYINPETKKINIINTESQYCKLNTNSVTGIIQDETGLIWVSTDHGGVNIINKKDLKISFIMNNPFNERSLCDNSIISIYKDYQGFIWLGSFKRGFSYFHTYLFNFNLYKIKLENSKIAGYNDIDNFDEIKKGTFG